MRLNRIRLAGFKSFVDPTTVHLPGNLTGVVGPNGCGKSNIIDAVRWVMGELSARHLRGDSMADVIFNGSSARKPVGTASVELVFDNSDGKIGGAVRELQRDLAQAHGRARRHLELLHQRRPLPPQGHHPAVPRHRPGLAQLRDHRAGHDLARHRGRAEDMRAFIEEAAGISLYKERRRETESRIADTRENLARVQRSARRGRQADPPPAAPGERRAPLQELKAQERTLTAELLALRLRELDSGAASAGQRACDERELAMQRRWRSSASARPRSRSSASSTPS